MSAYNLHENDAFQAAAEQAAQTEQALFDEFGMSIEYVDGIPRFGIFPPASADDMTPRQAGLVADYLSAVCRGIDLAIAMKLRMGGTPDPDVYGRQAARRQHIRECRERQTAGN